MTGSASPGRGPVILWGMMGVGKSTVGPLVAAALECPFVDLDQMIEEEAGCTIPELFAREGEAGFRAREAAALEQLCQSAGGVLAVGGGALASDEALRQARAAGTVIVLEASMDELRRRIGDPGSRPLLASAPDAGAVLERLLAARRPYYRQADVTVATDGLTPEGVAAAVLARLGAAPAAAHGLPATLPVTVPVELGERRYEVIVNRSYDGLGAALGDLGAHGAAVITDANVAAAQLPRLLAALEPRQPTVLTVEPGEESKTLSVAERVLEGLVAADLDRRSVIFALGGGVVGDLAGFVASVYLRGVRVVALPTSLLAQVDASVGGKTGVNLAAGKNLVGTFYQPSLCYVSLEALVTLPPVERSAGLAEVVKHALIADAELLGFLETHAEAVRAGELDALQVCVTRSVATKAAVVARDEREAGERMTLNLGHTVGHAIELASGYRMRHGEAVALGLLAALRVSVRLGRCSEPVVERVRALLGRLGLPTRVGPWLRPEVLRLCHVDKKRREGEMQFVCVVEPGVVRVVPLTMADLAANLLPAVNG